MSIIFELTAKGCADYCHNKFTKANLSCGELRSRMSTLLLFILIGIGDQCKGRKDLLASSVFSLIYNGLARGC